VRVLCSRLGGGRTLPIMAVLAVLAVVWYLACLSFNAPAAAERLDRAGVEWAVRDFVATALSLDRPVLPAPHQVAIDLWANTAGRAVTSNRSLVYHASVTLASALVGFAMGTVLGIVLAVGIVHLRTLDRSLMPWVIASQTVPILAIAPMIVVVLGNLGFTGLVPKSIISAYLSFFPVTIGMVKGLRSPDPLQIDLMRTYSASRGQVFAKLRWPAAVPFLFPGLKVGVSLALVGAIVGELPTGAQAGLGARILLGSYYGQNVQIWSALAMAGLLALSCIGAVALAERLVIAIRGGQG
jgi:NitT/TauT family transport system permease protein